MSRSSLITHHSPLDIFLSQSTEDNRNSLARVLPQQLKNLRTVISVDPSDRRKLHRAQNASIHLELIPSLVNEQIITNVT